MSSILSSSVHVAYFLIRSGGTLFIGFFYVQSILIDLLTTCLATCSCPLSAISGSHMDPCRMDTQMDTVGLQSQPGWHTSLLFPNVPHRMAAHHTVTSGRLLIYPLAMKLLKCKFSLASYICSGCVFFRLINAQC